jgi:hypothetical protein
MARKSTKKTSGKKPKSKPSSLVYLDSYESWLQMEVNKKLKKR